MPRAYHSWAAEEAEFQQAQSLWEADYNKKAWDIMFIRIQHAVFNIVNKKIGMFNELEEVEDVSYEITADILDLVRRKRERGDDWKIRKLSSYCYLPCMRVYKKQKQFEDRIISWDEVVENQGESEGEQDWQIMERF